MDRSREKVNELKHMRGYDKAFSIIPHTFVPLPIPYVHLRRLKDKSHGFLAF